MYADSAGTAPSRFAVFVTDAANGRRLHLAPIQVEPMPTPIARDVRRRKVCPPSFAALLRLNPSLAETFRRALTSAVEASDRPADPVVNEYLLRLLREL